MPARPLTKAQKATHDRFEAADPAPESFAAESPAEAPADPDPSNHTDPEPAPVSEALGATSVVPAGALAVRPTQTDWTPNQLAALEAMSFKRDKPGPGELQVFLNYSQRTGLDPFARQIYMVPRWNKNTRQLDWTIQTGIDGMRVVAQRSGEYAGQTPPMWCGPDGQWRDVWLEAGPPSAARVGVHRRGFAEPLYAVARLISYAPTAGTPGSMMWDKMPDVMLSKVAEALALRKAFPHDLSGIYVKEEMDQADVVQGNVIDSRTPSDPPPPPPAPSDPEAVAAELRAAMMLAATSDHKALSEQWGLVRKAGLSGEPIEWNGSSGTLGDLIVWLGSNLQRGAAEAAAKWLADNPEEEPSMEEGPEEVAGIENVELPVEWPDGQAATEDPPTDPNHTWPAQQETDPWATEGVQ